MKLYASYETSVFENNGGGISITQVLPLDEDQLVALTTEQARLVARELVRLADLIEEQAANAERENQENA